MGNTARAEVAEAASAARSLDGMVDEMRARLDDLPGSAAAPVLSPDPSGPTRDAEDVMGRNEHSIPNQNGEGRSHPAVSSTTARRRSLNAGSAKALTQSRPDQKRPKPGATANGRISRTEPHGRKTVSRAEMRRP